MAINTNYLINNSLLLLPNFSLIGSPRTQLELKQAILGDTKLLQQVLFVNFVLLR